MTNTEYIIGITEVNEVLKNFSQEDVKKVPESFLKFLEVNSNPEYKVNLDFSQPLFSCGLRPQSVILLTLIYNEFWCDKAERDKLKEVLKENSKLEKRRYDKLFSRTEDIFESPNNKKLKDAVEKELVKSLKVDEVSIFDDEEEKKAKEMVVYKESFIKRMFKKILNIFK